MTCHIACSLKKKKRQCLNESSARQHSVVFYTHEVQELSKQGNQNARVREELNRKDHKEISGIIEIFQFAAEVVVTPLSTFVKTLTMYLKICILLYKSYTS